MYHDAGIKDVRVGLLHGVLLGFKGVSVLGL